jgi:hypothetical protein
MEDIAKANPDPAGEIEFADWKTRALELAASACIPDI